MNKRDLFLSAHAVTRKHMEQNPKDKYREVFARALRFLYATFKNKTKLDATSTSDAFAPTAKNTDSTVENDQTIIKEQSYMEEQPFVGDYSYMGYQPVRSENPFAKEQPSQNVNENVGAGENPSYQQGGLISLPYKTVMVNEYSRIVALKIVGSQIAAKIVNNCNGASSAVTATWDTETHAMPVVISKNIADKKKAASYARLFILERLKIDNISLNVKTNTKNVEYIHLDTQNGVWCDIFENGYIRGMVDGVAFAWDIFKYNEAVIVNTPGFKGVITKQISTEKIKARLKLAGYNNLKEVREEVSKIAALSLAKRHIKSIVITNTNNLTVIAYENGYIVSKIDGKYFVYNTKTNDIKNMHDDVKEVIRPIAVTPNLLVEYVKRNGTIASISGEATITAV